MTADSGDDAAFSIVAEGQVPTAPAAPTSFTGDVERATILPARLPGGLRADRFAYAPGARSHWHVHEGEQALVVLSGCGLVQWEGLDDPRRIEAGDWVHVLPGVPHWHGATPDSSLVHLAVTAGGATVWLDPVSDEEYPVGPSGLGPSGSPAEGGGSPREARSDWGHQASEVPERE